jgi:hypothetical protein
MGFNILLKYMRRKSSYVDGFKWFFAPQMWQPSCRQGVWFCIYPLSNPEPMSGLEVSFNGPFNLKPPGPINRACQLEEE